MEEIDDLFMDMGRQYDPDDPDVWDTKTRDKPGPSVYPDGPGAQYTHVLDDLNWRERMDNPFKQPDTFRDNQRVRPSDYQLEDRAARQDELKSRAKWAVPLGAVGVGAFAGILCAGILSGSLRLIAMVKCAIPTRDGTEDTICISCIWRDERLIAPLANDAGVLCVRGESRTHARL